MGPSKTAETAEKEVKAAYIASGVELVPLGVHDTMITIDWGSCFVEQIYTQMHYI